jgi:RHS repeat-associated protein
LGSPRVITDKQGNVINRRDFMPFGEELGANVGQRTEAQKYSNLGADNIRQRFTGYEKDTETQLDFAEARMYQNKHGRFTAVDPLMASANPGNPQTFNRYIYTGNNPINNIDPSGLEFFDRNGTVYWFDGDPPDESYRSLTGQQMTVGGTGCVIGRESICASQGDVVRFDTNNMYFVSRSDGGVVVDAANKIANATIEVGESSIAGSEMLSLPTSSTDNASMSGITTTPDPPSESQPEVPDPAISEEGLDYSETAYDIIEKHIDGSNAHKKSQYAFSYASRLMGWQFYDVMAINDETFRNARGFLQPNGNTAYIYARPVLDIGNSRIFSYVGRDINDGNDYTNVNTLVVKTGTMKVITSHPGLPDNVDSRNITGQPRSYREVKGDRIPIWLPPWRY